MKRFSTGLFVGFIAGLILATTTLTFAADSIKLIVNGKAVFSDVPPQIINDRTMIPARALAEALGAQVGWDETTSSVIVTRPEVTRIVEPKPLNTTGQVQTIGPSDFKESVGKALALLKEKSPEDYKLVSNFTVNIYDKKLPGITIAETVQPGIINIYWQKFLEYNKLSTDNLTIRLAGVLVHESTHGYQKAKGLGISVDHNNIQGFTMSYGLSYMESEILAFLHERHCLQMLGAPKFIIDSVSLDRVADTNYFNKIKSW